ncbi:MAG: tetratricopeptide repeat protein [Candidatus Tritonobacter lacicola]|nr:tetratricopeptide repeat protein [Candidatus Tritonobacter lacicola]
MNLRHNTTVFLLLIFLLTFITFSPVLKAGFINWDDDENVVYREEIRSFSLDTLPWLFTNFTVGDFKPLTWTSYMLDYRVWGLDPFGYHLGNLILHAASSCLVFLLLIRLANSSRKELTGTFLLAAFFAALFFALHPLRVGSVAWVSERKGLLCAFFYLAAVLAYVEYARRGKAGWFIITLLLSCAALLSKPVAVTIPLILLLLDACTPGRMKRKPGRVIMEKIPFFAAAAAVAAMACFGQTRHGALTSLQAFGPWERILLALNNCAFYLYRTVLPLDLAAVYPPPGPIRMTAGYILTVIAPLLLISGAGLVLWRRGRRWLPACWLWYLVTVFPVSGFFPAGLEVSADRWTYLPAAGISGVVFIAALALFRAGRLKSAAFAGGTILALLAFLSFAQARTWNNSERLWADAVSKYPDSPVARAHYGQLLFQRGDDEEAVAQLQRAIDLLQDNALLKGDISFAARTNLAQALGRSGRPEEAAAILEDILKDRDSWLARHSLGGIYRRMNRTGEAAIEYEKALRKRPDWVPTLCDYGLMMAQTGNPDRAIRLYRQALAFNPGSPRARYNLALAFLDTGQKDKAVAALRSLAAEFPDNAMVLRALTVAYSAAGREEEAARTGRYRKGVLSTRELPYSRGEKPGILYPVR